MADNMTGVPDTLVEKVMKSCGIENATVIFKGSDYFISMYQMETKDSFELEIKDIKKDVSSGDFFQIVLTVDGKRYMVSVEVSTLRLENGKLLITCRIVGKMNLEVRSKLDEIYESLRFMNNRQDNRIRCNEETLKEFNIVPKFRIVFPRREYNGFMRDISLNGINFLTVKEFENENSDSYVLNVDFQNPPESISLMGNLLRRTVMNVSGNEFLNVVMTLREDINLSKRIKDYLSKTKENNLSLVVG